MREYGGTPSRRDKCGTPAAISPAGAVQGIFAGGHHSGLAGCKLAPLLKGAPLPVRHRGDAWGEPWGASPVRGWAISLPLPPVPQAGRYGSLPVFCGRGGCGRGNPSPAPQRTLLRAGFAHCQGNTRAPRGGVCLRERRPGLDSLPPPTARPSGRRRGAGGVGTSHQPHSEALGWHLPRVAPEEHEKGSEHKIQAYTMTPVGGIIISTLSAFALLFTTLNTNLSRIFAASQA